MINYIHIKSIINKVKRLINFAESFPCMRVYMSFLNIWGKKNNSTHTKV